VQTTCDSLHNFSHQDTRIIIGYYNTLWEPLLKFGEMIYLKMPTVENSWLSGNQIENLLFLSNFEVVLFVVTLVCTIKSDWYSSKYIALVKFLSPFALSSFFLNNIYLGLP